MHLVHIIASLCCVFGMVAAPLLIFKPYRALSLNGAAATGLPAGQILALPQYGGRHSALQITWDYAFAGTALATVNVRLEGTNQDNPQNLANALWIDLDDGTVVGGEPGRHVVNKEVKFVRVRVTATTGGDGTSVITAGIHAN